MLRQIASGHKLTNDEVLDLVASNEELSDSLEVQDGQLSISKEAIEKLRDAYVDNVVSNEKQRKKDLQAEQQSLNKKLGMYAKQMWGMRGVADVRQALVDKMEALEAKANNMDNNIFVRFWATIQKI